jgi:hypothetical protein
VTETGEIVQPDPPPASAPKINGKDKAPAWNPVQALVDAGICENNNAAATLLNKHVPHEVNTPDKLIPWGKLYRGWRDLNKSVEEAVQLATKGEVPQ